MPTTPVLKKYITFRCGGGGGGGAKLSQPPSLKELTHHEQSENIKISVWTFLVYTPVQLKLLIEN
jgi:hypothetical protein